MFQLNLHSATRAAQRNLMLDEIKYVTIFGKRFHRAGAIIYYLRECDIPPFDRSDPRWARLIGTAVVLSKDGSTVITVWRNRRNGLKRIKRKPEHSLRGYH